MINFKDFFRFSQKEVSCLFKNTTIKSSWRGLKLLQAPLNCFDSNNKFGKLLIITPRASGKAHERNLFRRRVKDIFYTNKLYLHPVNSVLIAYKNAMAHDFDHLQEFLIKNVPERAETLRVETLRVETLRVETQRVKTQRVNNRCSSQTCCNAHSSQSCSRGNNTCKACAKTTPPLKLWQRLFIATFDVIRPVFGFIGGACIYPVSCSDYAKHIITTKPFYKSIPLIILRVLSCNPITALVMRWRQKRS